MRPTRWIRVSWSLLLAGFGSVALAADDPVLTGKGLTKQGTNYVLVESEKPVLAKLRDARGLFKDLAATYNERGTNQQLAARADELEQQRVMLQSQLDALTQQAAAAQPVLPGAAGNIGGVGPFGMGGVGGFGYGGQNVGPNPVMAQREQVRQQLLAITNEQRAVKNQSPQGKETAALNKRAQKAEEGLKASLAELRKQVDEVQKQYADLEADATVKTALTEARKTSGRIKVGPSDAFVAATRELEKAERTFLDKRPTPPATTKKKSTTTAKAKK